MITDHQILSLQCHVISDLSPHKRLCTEQRGRGSESSRWWTICVRGVVIVNTADAWAAGPLTLPFCVRSRRRGTTCVARCGATCWPGCPPALQRIRGPGGCSPCPWPSGPTAYSSCVSSTQRLKCFHTTRSALGNVVA